jgi:rfaE bifunctional protein nucleotidyltransferase chain/domain/rfaE bifunctional protein kinase chain/domain
MTLRITVVGDVLLDRDVVGSVSRVCPDAPVPVVDVQGEVARPGGAGLAATLLAQDGLDVTLVAPVGQDAAGRNVSRLLAERGVRLLALPTSGTTREKVRVRAGDQSLVRLDLGTACAPSGDLPESVLTALRQADAVLVCDYAGGTTADPGLRCALEAVATARPLVWDPHQRGERPVPGARLVTPNEQEAAALAAGAVPASSPLAGARRRADQLLAGWQAHAVCVTLGARGALLACGSGAPLVVPAERVDGGDTCGAGDRFAASAAAALAAGEVVSEAVQRAVAAASVFVAAGGAGGVSVRSSAAGLDEPAEPDVAGEASAGRAVPRSGAARIAQVRAAGGTVVATGGCFDLLHAGHVALLRAARALGDCLVVCLNSDDSVRRLKGPSRPLVPEVDRVHVLEALECVDAVVVFNEDNPQRVIDDVRPDVWAKGGDYALSDLPEAEVVARWGGETVVLPYLDGRSTTALIGAAAGRTPTTTKETR